MRLCPRVSAVAGDEVTFIDFGRPDTERSVGEGDAESMVKGLLRHLEPLVVDTAILDQVWDLESQENDYQLRKAGAKERRKCKTLAE